MMDGGRSMHSDDVTVRCPYCFEWVEILVEPDTSGSLVLDCEICCQPWSVTVERGRSGRVSVDVQRLQ